MHPQQSKPESPRLPAPASIIQPSSPRYPLPGGGGSSSSSSNAANTPGAQRKIAIAVDLSDESAYALKWAVENYLRPDDNVIVLHVRPTSVLYGADWGFVDRTVEADADEKSQQKLEDEFEALMRTKLTDLAQPLVEAGIGFKLHIVKDHDLKERLCLEVERLGVSAMIMGSRGFGAVKRSSKGRLGSVSDYCVHHCVCPVVVVRFPEDKDAGPAYDPEPQSPAQEALLPVPEEELDDRDADEQRKNKEGNALE